MQKRIIWKPETRKVSDLIPWDHNPRIITELGLRDLKASFDEIGMAQPININTKNEILSGHARCLALKEEDPDQEVMVLVPDRVLTPKQEEAVIVRMNKNIAGQWDMEKLANHFDINDLVEWGFTENELEINIPALEPEDLSDKNKEIDTDNFGNDLEHTCPKCGFEFNE